MRLHLRSKGRLITPALKEIRRTRAECVLQWHTENGHEDILFTDEKFFTIGEQHNNQNNKIYAQTSLEVRSKVAGMPSPFVRHGLVGGVPSGDDTASFVQEMGTTGVRVYQEDVLQRDEKQFNMTLFSGQEWVFLQDAVPAQKPRRLRSGSGGTFRPLSAPRIGPRGVQASNLGIQIVDPFGGHGLPNASQQPGQSEKIPRESSGRDPPGDGACRDSRWPERLKVCVEAEGIHFKWHYYK